MKLDFSDKNVFLTLTHLAKDAGKLIMHYREQGVGVVHKADCSPVTIADKEADKLITAGLLTHFPHIPIISEEAETQQSIVGAEAFWLVDPLDGTKNFVRGGKGFTVNIGLIEHGCPVAGVIYIPAQGVLYYGAVNHGAFRQRDGSDVESIAVRDVPDSGRVAAISHDHAVSETQEILSAYRVIETVSASSSQKFCRVAEGSADIYPRLGPTMEWDTAAGHAILLAAGGSMTQPDGQPFMYGKQGFLNGGFIALGR
jgi:3'(2'), 5'-bisphosphate nucleotidase